MANKKDNYKKIRTILVYGKKKCIYMKPKGTREYVKSKGEFVLLSVYAKRVEKIAAKKLVKNKNGKKKIRGGEPLSILKYKSTKPDSVYKLILLKQLTNPVNLINIFKQRGKPTAAHAPNYFEEPEILPPAFEIMIKGRPVYNPYDAELSDDFKAKYYYEKNGQFIKIDAKNIIIDYDYDYREGNRERKRVYFIKFNVPGFDINTPIYRKFECNLASSDGSLNLDNINERNILYEYCKSPSADKLLYINDIHSNNEVSVSLDCNVLHSIITNYEDSTNREKTDVTASIVGLSGNSSTDSRLERRASVLNSSKNKSFMPKSFMPKSFMQKSFMPKIFSRNSSIV